MRLEVPAEVRKRLHPLSDQLVLLSEVHVGRVHSRDREGHTERCVNHRTYEPSSYHTRTWWCTSGTSECGSVTTLVHRKYNRGQVRSHS